MKIFWHLRMVHHVAPCCTMVKYCCSTFIYPCIVLYRIAPYTYWCTMHSKCSTRNQLRLLMAKTREINHWLKVEMPFQKLFSIFLPTDKCLITFPLFLGSVLKNILIFDYHLDWVIDSEKNIINLRSSHDGLRKSMVAKLTWEKLTIILLSLQVDEHRNFVALVSTWLALLSLVFMSLKYWIYLKSVIPPILNNFQFNWILCNGT
jgi:hypothetical protein